ncbi:hypothetical protein Celal_3457 [Cellulophaga algicola DSM 14237]|uniref:Lipoprotein n=1 Tax=Cellulophaga algicola (strain DSM 14237 / IC166 / ACAM 630) TaxID=688270 RepID=E6X7L1_CELAD|nr:hypothetical protein [Cellulophaga algicola]ADV50721.1 hypothetical protein Celal_3457 [Cellulophaga algicola DSM 14237]
MKHLKTLKSISILTLFFGLLLSCEKEEAESFQINEAIDNNIASASTVTELGSKMENPYSVSSMKKAWENLEGKGIASKNGAIKATHLYVKFKPESEEHLSILKMDSTIALYDIPLDYEIKANGDFYRDPDVPSGQPTYQYAALPVGKKLPSGVPHEILEELFIPDEDGDFTETSKSMFASKVTIEMLVDESLKLTGNLSEGDISSSLSAKSKWRPSGTIKVWDDEKSTYVGVAGLRVKARRWFTTHNGFTDANGYYSCDGRFRRDANYSFEWEI